MKKIITIILTGILVATIAGCSANAAVPSATATPAPTPSATATPAPTPTATPDPASVILMAIPETEQANFPIPEAYQAVDKEADISVPYDTAYPLYSFTDTTDATQYRAFGQKQNADQTFAGERGWYALVIKDIPITAETIASVADGVRVLMLDKETGAIKENVIKSADADFVITQEQYDTYNIVYRVIEFDALTATPVDLTAEAEMYLLEPTATPEKEGKPSKSNSGSNNGGSSGSSSGGSSQSSGGSSGSSSGGSSSGSGSKNEGQSMEDLLPDEFEGYWDGETYIDNKDWYN